jgi:hypothetical protein
MKKLLYIILLTILTFSCEKEDDAIDYAPGYPTIFAGNWVVFEFPGGNIQGILYTPYDLATALDPNSDSTLVINNLYNSGVRVKVPYRDSLFSIVKGKQLDVINNGIYDIKTVSVDGFVTNNNPVLRNLVYNFAYTVYDNIGFQEEDIEDVIYMNAGFYDKYNDLIDTVLIIGYRKTGFEEVDYN